MEYDDIDQYVDQLFRDQESTGQQSLSRSDKMIADIDEVIQDAYNDALSWHNNRISEDSDPRSGLRSLPYVPWDEPIDGVAAMQGAIGGMSETSIDRNGYPEARPAKQRGLGCVDYLLITVVVLALFTFMAFIWK